MSTKKHQIKIEDGYLIFSRHKKVILHQEQFENHTIYISSDVLKESKESVFSGFFKHRKKMIRGSYLRSSFEEAIEECKEKITNNISKYKYKHGLTVMRCQPFHHGHIHLIDKMLKECNVVSVVLGSIQESWFGRNPFTFEARKKMIENHYKDNAQLKILGLEDINDRDRWAQYVLDFMKIECHMVKWSLPDVYYCGGKQDSDLFKKQNLKIELTKRSGSISGTRIREMCKEKDDKWKNYVPECNWKIVEKP